MAVAFGVGLRQRPLEKKGKEGRICGQPVPSLVPMHELTAAKPRDSSPPALGLSAETDSLLEEAVTSEPVSEGGVPGSVDSGAIMSGSG